MSRTKARLAALERQTLRDTTFTVWRQDDGGADRFTSAKHRGVILTRAQLDARPEPADGFRIVVERVAPSPTARQPGETF